MEYAETKMSEINTDFYLLLIIFLPGYSALWRLEILGQVFLSILSSLQLVVARQWKDRMHDIPGSPSSLPHNPTLFLHIYEAGM